MTKDLETKLKEVRLWAKTLCTLLNETAELTDDKDLILELAETTSLALRCKARVEEVYDLWELKQ